MSELVHRYLNTILTTQNLTFEEINNLKSIAQTIQSQVATLEGNPRFFYAGSFGKQTMIRARYDLDLVVYWPNTAQQYSIEGIYSAVGAVLKNHGWPVNSKNVCWEIPFKNGFHVDVVPGRALDSDYFEATLYRADTETTLKTSLKAHIDFVAKSGRIPIIKLMKLWRIKRQVPFKKSFILEIMTINGCKGKGFDDYQGQVFGAFTYIRDNIMTCRIQDPANSNNFLSDDLSIDARKKIKDAAEQAIAAKSWDDIFKF